MNNVVKEILEFVHKHQGYGDRFDEDRVAEGRFWNLLRVDLLSPDAGDLATYLKENTRLNDKERGLDGLGRAIEEKFRSKIGDNKTKFRENLVKACLEADAANRCDEFTNKNRVKLLREKLGIWNSGGSNPS